MRFGLQGILCFAIRLNEISFGIIVNGRRAAAVVSQERLLQLLLSCVSLKAHW